MGLIFLVRLSFGIKKLGSSDDVTEKFLANRSGIAADLTAIQCLVAWFATCIENK